VLGFLWVLSSTALAAESDKEEARAHVRKATATYNLGRYTEAAKEYEAAYELTLDQNLLFNVAQCYRLAGDRERAITAYKSFIRSASPSEQRDLARSKLRELEERRDSGSATTVAPAAASPVAPPPAAPSVGSVAAPPPPAPLDSAAASLAAPPASEPPAPSPFYKRWPFWTAVGAVVVGGVVLAVLLSRGSDDLAMSPTLGTKEY
jgi:tetratricopeptide (TPR) repeat protein